MKGVVYSVFLGVFLIASSAEAGALRALRSGITYIRIQLIADDLDVEAVKQAIHEAEHAIEPPTKATGFWSKRWQVIRHPLLALDLRRSFENLRRLFYISQDFPNPKFRELILNSIATFGFTHLSEMVIGIGAGTACMVTGDIPQALAWYGLALPGLYDVGCWIGQGALIFRPARAAVGMARRFTMAAVGRSARFLGVSAVLNRLFEQREVKAKLLEAVRSGRNTTFELEIADKDLLEFAFRHQGKGENALTLKFSENVRGHLALQTAVIDKALLLSISRFEWARVLKHFGWNVKGAIRQIRKLVRLNRVDLIEEEKTFVNSVIDDGTTLTIHFRPNAVFIRPTWEWRRSRVQISPAPDSSPPCQNILASGK